MHRSRVFATLLAAGTAPRSSWRRPRPPLAFDNTLRTELTTTTRSGMARITTCNANGSPDLAPALTGTLAA